MKTTLGNTIGALLLGTVGASILFGALAVQGYMYYVKYPKDWQFQKNAVAMLLFLSTIQLAFDIHAVYWYLIEKFGMVEAEGFLVWSFKLQTALDILIILLVQGLYALRIWKLGRNFPSRIWPCVVFAVVAIGWFFGIYLAVETYITRTFFELAKIHWVLYVGYASSTIIDITIAITICYYLSRTRSSFEKTNNKVLRVMQYVLICGFLTSACSLSGLISLITMPNTLIFVGIDFLLPKLYVNSYIAMLNARKTAQDEDSSMIDMSKAMRFRSGTYGTETTDVTANENGTAQDDIPFTVTKYESRTGTSSMPSTSDKNDGHFIVS